MGKKNNSNRYYFLIQYQKGSLIVSESIGGNGYLPISLMIETILKFVVKVRDELGNQLGGEVALKGLNLIFHLCNNSNLDWIGDGKSLSKYMNHKQGKSTQSRSERFDIQFQGIGGRDDESNEVITRFLEIYKNIIRGK